MRSTVALEAKEKGSKRNNLMGPKHVHLEMVSIRYNVNSLLRGRVVSSKILNPGNQGIE